MEEDELLNDDTPCWFVGHVLIHVTEDDDTYSVSATNLITGKFAIRDVESYPYITAAAIARQWQEERSF